MGGRKKGIEMFVQSVSDGSMSDEEVIEYLEEIFENGLDSSETVLLTKAVSYTHLTLPTNREV